MIKIAIQCYDEKTKETGSWLYDPHYGRISPVYSDILDLIISEVFQSLKELGQIEGV